MEVNNEDGMTLLGTLMFLKKNLHEEVTSFETDDTIVILELFNDILFTVSAPIEYPKSVLLYILQAVRGITVFLCGPQFQQQISKTIKVAVREVFSQTANVLLSCIANDFKASLMIPIIEPYSFVSEHHMHNALQDFPGHSYMGFLLFHEHKICYKHHKKYTLNSNDIFFISILERTINDINPNETKNKRTFLTINNAKMQCVLSISKVNDFTLILVTKNPAPTPKQISKISNLLEKLKEYILGGYTPNNLNVYQCPGLVSYILINRKTSDNVELYADEKVRKRMILHATESLMNGNIIAMKNELDFQFVYQLVFVNHKGQKESLLHTFIKPDSSSSCEVDYQKIIKKNFNNDQNIFCYELLAAFTGRIEPNNVLIECAHMFHHLTGIQSGY